MEAVDKLNAFEWPSCETEDTEDQLTDITNKYKNHPSINKSKSNCTVKQKFSFMPVTVNDVEIVIKNVPTKKGNGAGIPLNILKQLRFTYEILRDCIYDSIFNGSFPDSQNLGNITSVRKKDEPTDKENFKKWVFCPYCLKILKDWFMINFKTETT